MPKLIVEQIPSLVSDRLLLDPLSSRCREDLYRLFSDREVTDLMGIRMMTSISEVDDWLKKTSEKQSQHVSFEWGIRLLETSRFVGRCGLTNIDWEHKHCQISCALLKEFWGRGIAKEALEKVIAFAHESLKLHRIEALLWPHNNQMERVLVKLGFEYEGRLKEHYLFNGKFGDTAEWALLRSNGAR